MPIIFLCTIILSQICQVVHGSPREIMINNPSATLAASDISAGPTAIPYHVPNSDTTLLFTDLGTGLSTRSARALLEDSIARVQRRIIAGMGHQAIARGEFTNRHDNVYIDFRDYSDRQNQPGQHSMTNLVLLDALRGVDDYMNREKGGYFRAAFVVQTVLEKGKAPVAVGNGRLVPYGGNRMNVLENPRTA
ncbi:MAG: hypothetical protein Q9164_006167 [Protoblastenia rupestris]